MAKKSKKSAKKKSSKKKDEQGASKAERKAAAAAAEKQQKQQAKADAKAAKQQAAEQAPKPDQVELLKLALRDTEAKLVDAEHRLRQVQQQLDDERRALAVAAEQAVEDAVVEAAVQETVAEAVLDVEIAAGDDLPAADVAEVIAETLDELAAQADPGGSDPVPDHTGDAAAAAAVFSANGAGAPVVGSELTPPLPEEPPAEVPSEEWTLVRLRQEARRRGLTDTSNLPKARLLERLRQS